MMVNADDFKGMTVLDEAITTFKDLNKQKSFRIDHHG